MSQTSRDRDNSRRVRTHEKNSGETVRRLGTIIQSIFCAQSGAGIRLNFWKLFGESRYPGALSPVLENFRPAFSPDPTDSPWVSQDERSSRPKCEIISWGAGGLYTFLIFFSVMDHDFCLGPPIKTTQKQTIMSCTWGISYLKVFWTSDIIDYLVLTSNRQHGHWKISSRPDKSDKATTHSRNVESF